MRGVTGDDKHHSMEVPSLLHRALPSVCRARTRARAIFLWRARAPLKGTDSSMGRVGPVAARHPSFLIFKEKRKAGGSLPALIFLRKAKGITTDGTFLIEDPPCKA